MRFPHSQINSVVLLPTLMPARLQLIIKPQSCFNTKPSLQSKL